MPSISHIKPTYAFFFAGATPLGLGLALEYASKLTITSRIAGVYVALNVPDGPTVYIYNFDMSEPSANDLENQYDSTESSSLITTSSGCMHYCGQAAARCTSGAEAHCRSRTGIVTVLRKRVAFVYRPALVPE